MKLLKCAVCGNIVEVVEDKGVPIMCCGQQMQELKANTTDGALEKHVPVAEIVDGNLHVKALRFSFSNPLPKVPTQSTLLDLSK